MREIRRKIVLAGCMAAVMALSAGCLGKKIDTRVTFEAEEETEKAKSKKEKSGKKDKASQETMDEAALKELEQELYDAYIQVNNAILGSLAEGIDRYFEEVKFQEKFSTVEKTYQCQPIEEDFYDQINRAKKLLDKKPDEDELDQAFLDLYPVMKELAQTLDQVHEYTDSEEYKKDKYAEGKKLHALIWADYEEYKSLGNAFIEKLSDKASQQDEAVLEELKESGMEATYAFNVMINTAQEIQREISSQGINDVQVVDLDIDKLQGLYDRYMDNVKASLDHLADEEAMAAEGYPVNSPHYHSFETAIKDSQTALSGLFRRVREQKPVDEIYLDADEPGEGTIRKFDDTVGVLIEEYNQLLTGG